MTVENFRQLARYNHWANLRLYGAALDGTFGESMHLLVPEAAILVVSLFGALMETRRRGPDDAGAAFTRNTVPGFGDRPR